MSSALLLASTNLIKLPFHREFFFFFQRAQLLFQNNSRLKRNLSSSLSLFLFLSFRLPSPLISQAGWKAEDHSRCFLSPCITVASTFYLNISLLSFFLHLLSFSGFQCSFLLNWPVFLQPSPLPPIRSPLWATLNVVFDRNCKSEFIAFLVKLKNFFKERMFYQNGSFPLKFLVHLSFIYAL